MLALNVGCRQTIEIPLPAQATGTLLVAIESRDQLEGAVVIVPGREEFLSDLADEVDEDVWRKISVLVFAEGSGLPAGPVVAPVQALASPLPRPIDLFEAIVEGPEAPGWVRAESPSDRVTQLRVELAVPPACDRLSNAEVRRVSLGTDGVVSSLVAVDARRAIARINPRSERPSQLTKALMVITATSAREWKIVFPGEHACSGVPKSRPDRVNAILPVGDEVWLAVAWCSRATNEVYRASLATGVSESVPSPPESWIRWLAVDDRGTVFGLTDQRQLYRFGIGGAEELGVVPNLGDALGSGGALVAVGSEQLVGITPNGQTAFRFADGQIRTLEWDAARLGPGIELIRTRLGEVVGLSNSTVAVLDGSRFIVKGEPRATQSAETITPYLDGFVYSGVFGFIQEWQPEPGYCATIAGTLGLRVARAAVVLGESIVFGGDPLQENQGLPTELVVLVP